MNTYWFVKIYPHFTMKNEQSGELVVFNNWVEQVCDVEALSVPDAITTAEFTGIKNGVHYNDIIIVHK